MREAKVVTEDDLKMPRIPRMGSSSFSHRRINTAHSFGAGEGDAPTKRPYAASAAAGPNNSPLSLPLSPLAAAVSSPAGSPTATAVAAAALAAGVSPTRVAQQAAAAARLSMVGYGSPQTSRRNSPPLETVESPKSSLLWVPRSGSPKSEGEELSPRAANVASAVALALSGTEAHWEVMSPTAAVREQVPEAVVKVTAPVPRTFSHRRVWTVDEAVSLRRGVQPVEMAPKAVQPKQDS